MLKYILLALVVLVVILVAAYWSKVQSGWLGLKKFLREVRVEMQKVSWPTRNSMIASTIVVLVAVVAMTVVITAWDAFLAFIMQLLFSAKGA